MLASMSEIDPRVDMPLVNWGDLGVSELLPTGMVTLVLADVEGSTRLWETQPDEMTAAIARLSNCWQWPWRDSIRSPWMQIDGKPTRRGPVFGHDCQHDAGIGDAVEEGRWERRRGVRSGISSIH
jgi:hypothetical protein